ncbi:MAG: BrnT family toxin [Pyrinomonadaceae bacterium]
MSEFIWDTQKAKSNIRKHGVSFEEAITVFNDPLFVIFRSHKHSLDENRYVIIGMSDQDRLLAVSFTEANEIRIISARELTTRERRNYEKQQKNL